MVSEFISWPQKMVVTVLILVVNYDDVLTEELLMITLDYKRKMTVTFSSIGYVTEVVETFDDETENSIELQEVGWQAILDNFKRYVEGN